MLGSSQSVISGADHTTMTTNTVPCRIRMLPKIHRVRSNNNNTKTTADTKIVTITTKTETPKKAVLPTIQRIHTPSTVASSPAASVAKPETSPPPVNSDIEVEQSEPKPHRKQCAITSIPNVHKRVRPPAPVVDEEEDVPLKEISFERSEGDEEIAKTLMFGEDEGFEDILNGSIIPREEEEEDDAFLRRNHLINTSPQPNVNASMETELRRNRDLMESPRLLDNKLRSMRFVRELSFETTSSMAVQDRLHLNESPIRPIRQVVGEETILDTSREVEMVRNSFFDNEEMVKELEQNMMKSEIPKEISLVTVSPALVDECDFVSPMQRLRSLRSFEELAESEKPQGDIPIKKQDSKGKPSASSKPAEEENQEYSSPVQRLRATHKTPEMLKAEQEEEGRAEAKRREEAAAKQKKREAQRKVNITKHMAFEKNMHKQSTATSTSSMIKKPVQEKVLASSAKNSSAQSAKVQPYMQATKKKTTVEPFKGFRVDKKQPKKEELTTTPPAFADTERPSTPPQTGSFVPEWANKSLRKTSTPATMSPSDSFKSTVSTSTPAANSVPEWANKQLRKSTITTTRASSIVSISSSSENVISEELSSWMGKRRRASDGAAQIWKPWLKICILSWYWPKRIARFETFARTGGRIESFHASLL